MGNAYVRPVVVACVVACTPSSLSEAILAQEDQFPKPQYVILPPSSSSKLGTRSASALGGDRRTTVEAQSCFFVSPTTASSLDQLDVKYASKVELEAEMKQVATSAGVQVKDDDQARLVLSELFIRSGIGIPNPNGPCGSFETPTTVRVVTSEVVATKASFDTARSSSASGSVDSGAALGAASTGWTRTSSTKLQGENIVLSGQFTDVQVAVVSAGPYDLGTTPPNETKAFPNGFDGTVTIEEYRDSAGTLTFRANVPFTMQQLAPSGMTTCEPGTSLTKKQGERCYFWLPPGNAAVAVWWERTDNRIFLNVRGYRSNFGQLVKSN